MCKDNEYCCSTDKPSVCLSFPLQAFDAYCGVKASASKEIHRLNSERQFCVFVCELHYDVLFPSQKNIGPRTDDPPSAVLIVMSLTCSALGTHKHD